MHEQLGNDGEQHSVDCRLTVITMLDSQVVPEYERSTNNASIWLYEAPLREVGARDSVFRGSKSVSTSRCPLLRPSCIIPASVVITQT